MKIIVLGNIASGKSTLIQKVNSFLNFSIIAIDDFRQKYGDGSKAAELKARKEFFEAINITEDQIIECSGIGIIGTSLYEKLYRTNEFVLCIILVTPLDICEQRVAKRKHPIPFHKPIENIATFQRKVDHVIKSETLSNIWKKRKNTTVRSFTNSKKSDLREIVNEIIKLSGKELLPINDIDDMLSDPVQHYYGKEYLYFQKETITKNEKFLSDQKMISIFFKQLSLNKDIVDFGAGNCQWYPFIKSDKFHYYAIETNANALSQAPKEPNLHPILLNLFDKRFTLPMRIAPHQSTALFSFFLSHFNNKNLSVLFEKINRFDSIIIIDSLWDEGHKLRYKTKNLTQVKRSIGFQKHILLPKRFFDKTDIETLAQANGFKITEWKQGTFWFACVAKKV